VITTVARVSFIPGSTRETKRPSMACLFLGCLYLLFGLDDAFVDIVAAVRPHSPAAAQLPEDLRTMHGLPENPIALFISRVARRQNIIPPQCLRGKSSNHLDYNRFSTFSSGVYTN